jgi:aldehyde dehydrogenase (NAD+)
MDFLDKLGIRGDADAVHTGLKATGSRNKGAFESFSPVDGKLIVGKVYKASKSDYDALVKMSEAAFVEWRKVPPQTGRVVRQIGNELVSFLKILLASLSAWNRVSL